MSDSTPVDQIAHWITAYRNATTNAKAWQEDADRAKQHLTAALAEAGVEVGTVDGKPTVRWTTVNGTRLDTKKLRAEHPQLADQFTVPQITRRFTVTDPTSTTDTERTSS